MGLGGVLGGARLVMGQLGALAGLLLGRRASTQRCELAAGALQLGPQLDVLARRRLAGPKADALQLGARDAPSAVARPLAARMVPRSTRRRRASGLSSQTRAAWRMVKSSATVGAASPRERTLLHHPWLHRRVAGAPARPRGGAAFVVAVFQRVIRP